MTAPVSPLLYLQEDRDALLDLIHHNSDWIWEVDAQGRYTFCSDMVTSMLGRAPQDVIGKTPFDFMPPAEAERVGKVFAAIIGEQRPFSGLINRNIKPDGSIVVLETSGVPLFDQAGALRGYRGIDRDISVLGERVLHLEAVYDSAPIALFTIDRAGRIVMANEAMAQLLGRPQSSLPGLSLDDFATSAAQRLEADLVFADAGQPLKPYEFQCSQHWLYAITRPVYDLSDTVVGMSIGWIDITKRKAAEQELAEANERLAQYAREDYLTGLYNRRYLDAKLETELHQAQANGKPLSVCMIDVDYFKLYNDTLSHLEGDECLRRVANILAACGWREQDIVSRYGGEEFVLLLPACSEAEAWQAAEHVRQAIEAQRWPHRTSPIGVVTVSIGITTYEPLNAARAPDKLEMLAQADRALYRAKAAGKNRIEPERAAA